jgi:hypothetical protein
LPVALYSPDYQKMFADFNPAYSPWINFPDGLIHKGYVGICFDEGTISDAACRQYFAALNPDARHIEIALQWRAYGMATPPLKLHLEIVGPKPRRGWASPACGSPPFLILWKPTWWEDCAGNSSRGRYGLAREQEKLSYVLT